MTEAELTQLLIADCPGARVPCSRYGATTEECAPIAARVALIVARETSCALDYELAEHMMGLVVNDHDDIAHMLDNYELAPD